MIDHRLTLWLSSIIRFNDRKSDDLQSTKAGNDQIKLICKMNLTVKFLGCDKRVLSLIETIVTILNLNRRFSRNVNKILKRKKNRTSFIYRYNRE